MDFIPTVVGMVLMVVSTAASAIVPLSISHADSGYPTRGGHPNAEPLGGTYGAGLLVSPRDPVNAQRVGTAVVSGAAFSAPHSDTRHRASADHRPGVDVLASTGGAAVRHAPRAPIRGRLDIAPGVVSAPGRSSGARPTPPPSVDGRLLLLSSLGLVSLTVARTLRRG